MNLKEKVEYLDSQIDALIKERTRLLSLPTEDQWEDDDIIIREGSTQQLHVIFLKDGVSGNWLVYKQCDIAHYVDIWNVPGIYWEAHPSRISRSE